MDITKIPPPKFPNSKIPNKQVINLQKKQIKDYQTLYYLIRPIKSLNGYDEAFNNLLQESKSIFDTFSNSMYSVEKEAYSQQKEKIIAFFENNFSKGDIVTVKFQEFERKAKKSIKQFAHEQAKTKRNNSSLTHEGRFLGDFFRNNNQIRKKQDFEKEAQKEQIEAELSFLEKIKNCLKNGGLHPLIEKRTKKKFNLLVEHTHKRKTKKQEVVLLKDEITLENDYLKSYKKHLHLIINGQRIPFEAIQKISVTTTPVANKLELKLYKQKHRLNTDVQFFKECEDITNELINHTEIAKHAPISYDVWLLIHPKFRVLIEKDFKTKQFAAAVSKVSKELVDIIKVSYKKETGQEKDGCPLMNAAFSVKNSVFQIGDISTKNGKNKQQGYMQSMAGFVQAIRNPNAHANLRLDKDEALRDIIHASGLLNKFENRL